MGASSLSEADLHGLVDGHLESDRRGDILRRLAASPADRALVEAWQEQNDLIRSAFVDVEKEPLPVSLDLAPPPRLRCISRIESAASKPAPVRRAHIAGLATILLVAAGLGGSWMLLDAAAKDPEFANLQLRGTIDETLAGRAAQALDVGASRPPRQAPALAGALPTTTIPDLGPSGFSLTSAETEATEPASLVFHYQNAAAERLVISVARAPQDAPTMPPTAIGKTYSWHRRDNAFAIAGTVRPDRLRAIAVVLQGDSGDE